MLRYLFRRVAIVSGLLVCCFHVLAAATDLREAEGVYLRSVERLMQGDTDIDYTALRLAYARTRPYESERLARLKGRADLLFQLEEWSEASRIGIQMIEINPAFAEAHMLLRGIYLAVNEPEEAAFHEEIARGLIASVEASGDGRSRETAYAVIDDSEVRMLTRLHGWTVTGRSSSIRGDSAWIVLDVIHPERRPVYFRVLRPLPEDDDEGDDGD